MIALEVVTYLAQSLRALQDECRGYAGRIVALEGSTKRGDEAWLELAKSYEKAMERIEALEKGRPSDG